MPSWITPMTLKPSVQVHVSQSVSRWFTTCSRAHSECAGPKFSWGQAVATLGRPHRQEVFGSAEIQTACATLAPKSTFFRL